MVKTKGLLSDCERLFTPMTSDQEGHLRGGFGSISVFASGTMNGECTNEPCTNPACNNNVCVNDGCTNVGCVNSKCSNGESKPTTKVPSTKPHNAAPSLCGFL